MVDLVPVDHEPEFEVAMPPKGLFDYSGVGAAMPESYGAKSPIKDPMAKALIDTMSLPKRAVDAAKEDVQHYSEAGFGDPNYTPKALGPSLETAAMMMGGGVGGVPAKAGESVLGSGVVRRRVAGPSGMTTEDFELRPDMASPYRAPAMLYNGEVIEGKGMQNHADIAEKYNFPQGMVPGFVTKNGEFHYQYAEDVPKTGITAYHGSPHDFDKFDLSKIGTGEGAQSYGHGLYFAENEGTANSYKQTLAGKGLPLREIIEKHLPDETWTQSDLGKIYSAALNGDKAPEGAAKSIQMMLPHLRDEGVSFMGPPGEKGQKIASAISDLRDKGRGKMYEVNINADPEHFLDWDKPLSEQPPIVQDMARNADLSHLAPGNRTRRQIEMWREGKLPNKESEPSGNVLHSALTDYGMNSGNNAALTNKLSEAGIPGIKYLDHGSRVTPDMNKYNYQMERLKIVGKENTPEFAEAKKNYDAATAARTRNYVVFNDKLIDILKKYGIAGLPAAGAATGAMQAQPSQADMVNAIRGQGGG